MVVIMLTQENIDELNRTLKLSGASLLTQDDIAYLNAVNARVYEKRDIYLIVQSVLLVRLKNTKLGGGALSRLKMLAEADACELTDKKPQRPKAIIPIIGGILGKHYDLPKKEDAPELPKPPPIIIDVYGNASPYVTSMPQVEITINE